MSIETLPPAPAPARIDAIQALRAAAALLVVGFHLHGALLVEGMAAGAFAPFAHGEAGVDLFFVISGFIILYTTRRRPDAGVGRFIKARFVRIYPIYWVILAIYVALGIAMAAVGQDTSIPIDPRTILNSATLFPYAREVIPVAWTLTLEVTFYALFAATYFTLGLRGFLIALALWALAAQLVLIAAPPASPWLSLTMYSGNIEFLYGAVIALLAERGRPRFALPIGVLGLVLFCLAFTGAPKGWGYLGHREFAIGLPAAMILYGALGWQRAMPRWVIQLGDASYILYLGHLLALSMMLLVCRPFIGDSTIAAVSFGVVYLVIVSAGSVVAHHLIERPLTKWTAKALDRVKLSPPTATTSQP